MKPWLFFAGLVASMGCMCLLYEMHWTSSFSWKFSIFPVNTISTLQLASEDIPLQDSTDPLSDSDLRTTSSSNEMSHATDDVEMTKKGRIKTILLWNSWYNWKDYQFGLGRQPFKANCKVNTCRTTDDGRELMTSDAVVMFGRLIPYKTGNVLPKRASRKQLFVFSNLESPAMTYGKTGMLGNAINITMTYRRDSTVAWPEYDVIQHNQSQRIYHERYSQNLNLANKTNMVSWMISHCNKPGNIRIEYTRQLGKHVKVDIYGGCGNMTCDRGLMTDCMDMLEERYLFYLSFENSICTDYVTEKVYRTLQYNIVPIVMGGADYETMLPPHSFINVQDYRSPAELAKYLVYLKDNPDEYVKYFEWKKHFSIRKVPSSDAFCALCAYLHSDYKLQPNFDVGNWWEGDHCEFNKTTLATRFKLYDNVS